MINYLNDLCEADYSVLCFDSAGYQSNYAHLIFGGGVLSFGLCHPEMQLQCISFSRCGDSSSHCKARIPEKRRIAELFKDDISKMI